MKTLLEYYNNSKPCAEMPMQIIEEGKGDYVIYFTTPSALLIYKLELEGQISDGYWENARPYDHWKWVTKTEAKLDKEKVGYTGPTHSKKYSTEWLRKYVKKAIKHQAGDYDWTIRAFNYAKFGSLLNKTQLNKVLGEYGYRPIIENLPEEPTTNEGLNEIWEKKQYTKKYWEQTKDFFTDELLKKYYDSTYDFSNFEEDLKIAENAMNNNIYEE